MGEVTLIHGDSVVELTRLEANSIDSIVCDPPYALGFMGKAWDTHTPKGFQHWCEMWAREALRVLKPGGHLLAFGGTRTYHRLAAGIEDSGFEIRDSLHWLYGSGFPKSHNLKDDWQGWGTALKPAHEPIVLARKPLVGTVAANVLQHGTGALNVDGCRVESGKISSAGGTRRSGGIMGKSEALGGWEPTHSGRWPANVLLDPSAAALLDEQSGTLKSGSRKAGTYAGLGYMGSESAAFPEVNGNEGGASRFFPVFKYQAKATSRERPEVNGVKHPTVKPVELMRWLVRLVTPAGGVVLDPFAGSGATVEAALLEGMRCIAIEREADYLPLIEARIERQAA